MTDQHRTDGQSDERRQAELLAEEVAALRQRLADAPARSR